MRDVYIIDLIRSPIGKYGGILSSVRPDDMLASIIKSLLVRNPKIDPNEIEDVIAGNANQAGEDNRNIARMASLLAGLPVAVAGNTVNRLCASGLQAIMDGARQIMCKDAEMIIACGVESMSRAPFVLAKSTVAFQRTTEVYDTTLGWRFVNNKLADIHYPYSMGETAENIAIQWQINRESQDEFAFRSQEKYFSALKRKIWDEEIIPFEIETGKDIFSKLNKDEHPRMTTLEKLSLLKPAFKRTEQ